MKSRSIATLVLLAASATGCANRYSASRPDLLPLEVASAGGYVPDLGQAPLWPTAQLTGYRTRIRMTVSGIMARKWMIEIDEDSNGIVRGRFREFSGIGSLLGRRRFAISASDYQKLRELIDQGPLWSRNPKFWSLPKDEICLDGEEFTFERLDASGYRFAAGNAPCGLGAHPRAVAAQIFELSGRHDLTNIFSAGVVFGTPSKGLK